MRKTGVLKEEGGLTKVGYELLRRTIPKEEILKRVKQFEDAREEFRASTPPSRKPEKTELTLTPG